MARAPSRRRPRGMTLIEVLVAFVCFLLLVTALVTLATTSLDTWGVGEERKDLYDRAQRILDAVSEDVRCTFADERFHQDDDGRDVQHALFACDLDSNRMQRLRLVRTGGDHRVNADPGLQVRRPRTDLNYTELWEIAWALDSDPLKPHLLRGVRFFDRRQGGTLLSAKELDRTSGRVGAQHFRVVDTGVLWLGVRLWTQYTSTWGLPGESVFVCANRSHQGLVVGPQEGKCPQCQRDLARAAGTAVRRSRDQREIVGPSTLWDSSRLLGDGGLDKFIHHRVQRRTDDPDFCYPEIVRITVVLEAQMSAQRGTALPDAITESDMTIRVDSTQGMPDGPDHVKIGSEWIEYSDKTFSELTVRKRGARGTTAQKHEQGVRVRFGESFTTDVHVPVYREVLR